MSEREKRHEEQIQPNPGNDDTEPTNPAREQVESLRTHASGLLAAARSVIDDTLSGESENYLNSVRQQGGQ
jgi:hypothetical protein